MESDFIPRGEVSCDYVPPELQEPVPYLFREQAASLGFKQYGRSLAPCLRGHTPTRRWTDSGRCVLCSMGL